MAIAEGTRRSMFRGAGAVIVSMGLVVSQTKDSPALDVTKTVPGADHAAAHAISTGNGVRVGVIEVGGGTPATRGIDLTKYHFPGRWIEDRDFSAAALPINANPPFALGDDDHGTLVSDVVGSGALYTTPVTFLGVGRDSNLYIAWWSGATDASDYAAIRASLDWYSRGPAAGPFNIRIFNNSWGKGNNDNGANNLALFFDWFASRRDVVICKSAGNTGRAGAQITQPGDAHNIITVGALDSTFRNRVVYSSYRLRGDGPGVLDVRGKPDIVAPGGDGFDYAAPDRIDSDAAGSARRISESGTSFASPHVAGTSALLVQVGLGLPGPSNRSRLAHKAIILNSARKRFINPPKRESPFASDYAGAVAGRPATDAERSDYNYLTFFGSLRGSAATPLGTDVAGTPRTGLWTPTKWDYNGTLFTTFRPLDDELGTGALDAERALIQFQPGFFFPGPVPVRAWNRDALAPGMPDDIYSITPRIQQGTFITATLTWDRAIEESDNNGVVDGTETYANGGGGTPVPDFDLFIYKSGTPPVLIAQSIGVGGAGIGENVEHLHIPVPMTANYEIHVRNLGPGGGLVDYGLAWWTLARTGSCWIPSIFSCVTDTPEDTCLAQGGSWTLNGTCACCPGDTDHSGVTNRNDISSFLNALITGAPNTCADVDGNGAVNGRDIRPFVQLALANGGSGTACVITSAGACCIPDGSCVVAEDTDHCDSFAGVFHGAGSTCIAGTCPAGPTGACCLSNGTCLNGQSAEACSSQGGSYGGNGTLCSGIPCVPTPTGACCLQGGACANNTEIGCAGQGGNYLGDGTNCGTQNCVTADCIPPGQDCFVTACGNSNFSFVPTPIPAGFFNPGSNPFTGTVVLGGDGSGPFGTDTIVERLGTLCFPDPLPSTDSVPIELVSLSLLSCAPITVIYTNPPATEQWNVAVGLSETSPPSGTMTATKTQPNGGTFTSDFYVQPVFTFTNVNNPSQVRVLDTEEAGIPPMHLGASNVPWRHVAPFPTCSPNFAPGASEDPQTQQPCCVEVCHSSFGQAPHDHCVRPPECSHCPQTQCPNNDNCNCATVITTGVPVTGTTVGMTNDYAGTCGTSNGTPDVWYRWTADCTATAIVSLCGSSYDTVVEVLSACGGPTIICNDDFCGTTGLQSQATFPATAGTTYLIRVSGFNGNTGAFTLVVNCQAACVQCPPGGIPENEPNCGLPTDTVNGGCNSTPNVFTPITCGATYCGTIAYDGVNRDTDWYQVITNSDTQLTWTARGQFDLLIGIIDNHGIPSCAGVTAFVTSASVAACTDATVTACVPAGTWWLFVGPQFTAAVACPAPYTATLSCAPCVVPTGACCTNGQCTIVPQTTCVGGGGTYLGDGTLCSPNPCSGALVNDNCPNAILVAISSTTSGSTLGATAEVPAPPTCVTDISAPGVWYQLVGNGHSLTVTTCDGNPSFGYDSKLNVYTGACGNWTCVTGNDDGQTADCAIPSGNLYKSRVTFCSTLGTTYLILVQGFNGATGPFVLSVLDGNPCGLLSSPGADACTSAPALLPGSSASGTTVGATLDGSASCGLSTGPDVWWVVSASPGSAVAVNSCGSGYDTVLSAHSACPGTASNELACSDDSCGAQSSIAFTMPASGTALIRLSGYNGVSGTYTVTRP